MIESRLYSFWVLSYQVSPTSLPWEEANPPKYSHFVQLVEFSKGIGNQVSSEDTLCFDIRMGVLEICLKPGKIASRGSKAYSRQHWKCTGRAPWEPRWLFLNVLHASKAVSVHQTGPQVGLSPG
jgi:hypothetical protein